MTQNKHKKVVDHHTITDLRVTHRQKWQETNKTASATSLHHRRPYLLINTALRHTSQQNYHTRHITYNYLQHETSRAYYVTSHTDGKQQKVDTSSIAGNDQRPLSTTTTCMTVDDTSGRIRVHTFLVILGHYPLTQAAHQYNNKINNSVLTLNDAAETTSAM